MSMKSHSNTPDEKFCTVLTDASWCPNQKVAGWAAWIVCNNERFQRFDAFFEKIESAREAEIKAIINGVYIAKRIFAPEHYHIVSDCVDAMNALQGKGTTKIWQDKLTEIIGTAKVTFKHVKAHTDVKDKRTFAHNFCDFKAKIAMRSLRTAPKESNDDKKR